jgi:molecular chaperone DnaJ
MEEREMPAQAEWLQKDYYAVLGVPESATQDEIARAYRKLARELHPDINPDSPGAEERFKEVSAAYDVIGDPQRRREYDEVRQLAASGVGGFGGFGGPGGFRVRVHNVGDLGGADLGDLGFGLGDLFGSVFGTGSRQGASTGQGGDVEASVRLSFDQAVFGDTVEVRVHAQVTCATCTGSGAAPGSEVTTCTTCGGQGVVAVRRGLFAVSQPCRECRGRGRIIRQPCRDCGGAGVTSELRTVRVRVPAGIDDGSVLRLAGQGHAGRDGAPAGDLYVHVGVTPHRRFGRRGRHLTLTVPVRYTEVALGAEIEVPTLEGEKVTVKVPSGTRSGTTLRVRHRGVPTGGSRGDLLVTVEIDVPRKPGGRERKALEQLAETVDRDVRKGLFED